MIKKMKFQTILNELDGYLFKININTSNGSPELELGFKSSWIFKENDKIGIEILVDNPDGKLLKFYRKESDIIIDDIFNFIKIIIETNLNIEKQEFEYEEKIASYQNKIKELKELAFKAKNDESIPDINNSLEQIDPSNTDIRPKRSKKVS